MSRTLLWLTVLVIMVVISAVGLWQWRSATSSSGETTDLKVRLGWVHQAQFAGFYMAKELGLYEKAGLNVELLELNQEINQVEELVKGQVDIGVMEAHQVLEGIGRGADIKVVMAVYQINPHALAARADSGIKRPEDFSGKVIGLAGGAGEGNALFPIFVEKFGGTTDVTYKNLGFDTVDDFLNNRADIIDVYSIDQPYLAEQRGITLNIIALDAYGFSTYGDVVVVSDRLMASNPDGVAKFVAATRQGWQLALENQEAAVLKILPYTKGSYRDANYQRHILQQSVPLIYGPRKDIGRMDLVAWSTLYEAMRKAGVIERALDLRDVYSNEFIR